MLNGVDSPNLDLRKSLMNSVLFQNCPLKKTCTLGKGETFGETALLMNKQRRKEVVAVKRTQLLAIEKKTFIDSVKEMERYKLDKKISFLKTFLFGEVDSAMAMRLSYYFKEIVLNKGNVLFKENELLDGLYIILKGKVSVW